MKFLFNVFMAAAVILFAGCQKQDLNQPGKGEGNKANLTASIGDITKVGIAEDVAGLKVTWSAGDKIGLYDENGNYACVFVLKAGEEGKTKADFEQESGDFDASKTYTVVYPYIENTADLTAYEAEKATRLAADQTQDGETLDHLGDLCFMEGANTESSISFTHTISILTLKLEKPAAADPAEVPTSIGFKNGAKSYNLNLTNGDWTNSAYMIIDPIADPARDLSFDVTTDAGKMFNFSVQTDKVYEAGKRYTATLTGGKLGAVNFMKFTIDTSKNTVDATDKTFTVPFAAGTISGYDLTILWGDGQKSDFPDGTNITQTNLTHTYTTEGQHEITIQSTQSDPTQQQIPSFNLYNNYSSVNNNPKKLISVNTPLLNMNSTDMSSTFAECSNLTTIPKGLFDKNTEVTNFGSCFKQCPGLTEIPAGLFDNNTKVTKFDKCFFYCEGLTEIPAGLFDNNTQVTDFSGCFWDCSGLTEIPAGLFDKNTKVTDFSYCFYMCSGLTEIPAGLFDKNTEAATFSYCFSNCTKAKLNSNIFCNEATEMSSRFDGRAMNFSYCFQNCGSDASITVGEGGTAPALWSYNMDASSYRRMCFSGVTKVSNVGEIDPNWK